ncbi:MAG: hypothetical protein J7642_21405 [Cyanobacteria bacterium SBC]|nr:hypothetical protein [Cyanobacteria bacterium SBC]
MTSRIFEWLERFLDWVFCRPRRSSVLVVPRVLRSHLAMLRVHYAADDFLAGISEIRERFRCCDLYHDLDRCTLFCDAELFYARGNVFVSVWSLRNAAPIRSIPYSERGKSFAVLVHRGGSFKSGRLFVGELLYGEAIGDGQTATLGDSGAIVRAAALAAAKRLLTQRFEEIDWGSVLRGRLLGTGKSLE